MGEGEGSRPLYDGIGRATRGYPNDVGNKARRRRDMLCSSLTAEDMTCIPTPLS